MISHTPYSYAIPNGFTRAFRLDEPRIRSALFPVAVPNESTRALRRWIQILKFREECSCNPNRVNQGIAPILSIITWVTDQVLQSQPGKPGHCAAMEKQPCYRCMMLQSQPGRSGLSAVTGPSLGCSASCAVPTGSIRPLRLCTLSSRTPQNKRVAVPTGFIRPFRRARAISLPSSTTSCSPNRVDQAFTPQ